MMTTLFISDNAHKLLYEEVYASVFAPPGYDKAKNLIFGVPFNDLLKAIDKGLVDFSKGTYVNGKWITADQLVLFYCHTNMKGHLFAALQLFSSEKGFLKKAIGDHDRVILIDVGCGPATAGLAFASCFPKIPFRYYGIDRAAPMRRKAKAMIATAKKLKLTPAETAVITKISWNNLRTTFRGKPLILLCFSYLFGSKRLSDKSVRQLSQLYRELVSNNPNANVQIAYTNSVAPEAVKKYADFYGHFGLSYSKMPPTRSKVTYFAKAKAQDKRTTEEIEYELFAINL